MYRSILVLAFTTMVLIAGKQPAHGDSIELVNGDLLHGKVVSLDDQELRLMSDIHGAVIIARDKVAAIGFGERNLARPAAETPRGGQNAQAAARRVVPSGDGSTVTATVPLAPAPAQDVLRQLRAQGLSAENIAELQKAMPLLREPAAKQYFDETVKGLTEGSINVDDVRKQAMRARDEYRKSAKSLGPEGEKALNQAVGGYLDILDRFIRETEPKAVKPEPTTKPPATQNQSPKPSEGDKKAPPEVRQTPPQSGTSTPSEKTKTAR